MKNKSQISIFIIVAILILFIVSFLVFSSFDSQSQRVEDSQNMIERDLSDLNSIKEQVDLCAERNLKRSLLISGLRGGFLYDDGEYYGPSAIPEETYDSVFISNMNLNWNNLLSNTLMISQSEVYMPSVDQRLILSNNVIYNKTIREDLERFVRTEFFKCVNFEDLERKGFEVSYDRFSGEISSIDTSSGYIRSNNLIGQIGDRIELTYDNQSVTGIIERFDNQIAVIKFDETELSQITFNIDLSDLTVENLDTDSRFNLVFADDSVSLEIFLPVTISQADRVLSINDIFTTADIRYKKILDLVSVLATEKYINRTLDYTNSNHILDVVNKYYSQGDELIDDIVIYRAKVNDSEEYKRYVYSVVDKESRIFGNNYVFNFGYENNAPEVNTTSFASSLFTEEEVVIFAAENNLVEIDLMPYTSDLQVRDNFVSQYLEYEYNGPDAYFSISTEGVMKFEGYQKKRYNFDITISDGETRKVQEFIFLTGLPDNNDNNLAHSCFDISNKEVMEYFPISTFFKNRIFNYMRADNYNENYAYFLYLEEPLKTQLNKEDFELYFSPTCLYNKNLFTARAKVTNLDTMQEQIIPYNPNTGLIGIGDEPYPMEVTIQILDSDGDIATEDYSIKLYPSSCLGPNPETNLDSINVYGGDRSCCNTQPIINSVNNNNPRSFINSNSALEITGTSVDAEAYFCYDIVSSHLNSFNLPYNYNHQIESMWNKYGQDITSLYEGRIQLTCDGTSATGKLNSVTSSSSDLTGNTIKVGYDRTIINSSIPYSLTKSSSAGVCSFCYIENPAPFALFANDDIFFTTGIKDLNPSPSSAGVAPLPYNRELQDLSNVYVKCDSSWYTSEDRINWGNSFDGEGGVPSSIFQSQGYCYQGETTCSGRANSPSYSFRVDNQPSVCTDWYSSGPGSFASQLNTGWPCGANGTCQNGVCS